MKVSLVAHHAPAPEGSAAGRQLFAVGSALRAEGHEVRCVCWQPREPADLPDWAAWSPLPHVPGWQSHGRALLHPRQDTAALVLDLDPDAVAVADDPASFAAVAHHPRNLVGVHFAVDLDRRALHDRSLQRVQDGRGEARAVRRAAAVWAFSSRVVDAIGRGTVVPATLPLPVERVTPVERPVVGLLADWSWRPNVLAAGALLELWHEVRTQVPGAELLLAGRGNAPVGAVDGVRWLGEVDRASDLLSQAAVFAFPCPDTSGPKMKTLDALAHGVPVLTTPAGSEGVHADTGVVTVPTAQMADALVSLLSAPQTRAELGEQAWQGMRRHHSPAAAAAARVEVLRAL